MKITFSLITALALVSAVNAQDKQPGIPEAQKLMERARDAKAAGRYDEAKELAEKAEQIAHAQKDGKGRGAEKGPRLEKPHHEAAGGKETEDKLARARHAIEEMHRAGKHEEAEQMERRVAGFMQHEKGPKGGKPHDEKGGGKGMDDKMARARHEIEELHRAGKHEEAEQLKHRIAEGMEHKKQAPQPTKEGEGPARLRHVMEAIKHLRDAGLNEQAEGLEKLARGMHEKFEHHEHAEKGRKTGPGPEGEQPRKGDKPHPAGNELHAMREQMEKMAHAIEELRAQLRGRGDKGERKD